ncbi:MAG TPA: sulfotransferase [Tepidisphaeraceae bacterium]|nr:sulfotransferase [Tepidisphaeraceae bacterium]
MAEPIQQTNDAIARARHQAAAGERYYRQAQFHLAVPHYLEAVRLWPSEPDLHYMLASAAWRAGELALVEKHYFQALGLNPKHAYAAEALSHWYRSIRRLDLAQKYIGVALALEPRNPEFVVSRAEVLADMGQADAAWKLLEPLLHANSELADRAGIVYLKIAPRIGREIEATEWVKQAVAKPGEPPLQRPQLLFDLAALLDRMGRYDEAFEAARMAHAVFPRPYDPAQTRAAVDRQISFCTAERLRNLPHATHASTRPVFILGMPRSGTSLIEQILASHPQVFGAGELDPFTGLVNALQSRGVPYPQCLADLTQPQVEQIASRHLSALNSLNATATYVTDKTPYNFQYLDLIELLFPQAKVIHCTRDPRDTCLSCYMTNFSAGNAFAWDLKNLGSHYHQYERLMAHWKRALTLPVIDVQYEQVVANMEQETRRLLDFLNLPWDESCLRFHENPRPVLTASRDQVRQPLYASSVGRWRHYQRHLGELFA